MGALRPFFAVFGGGHSPRKTAGFSRGLHEKYSQNLNLSVCFGQKSTVCVLRVQNCE